MRDSKRRSWHIKTAALLCSVLMAGSIFAAGDFPALAQSGDLSADITATDNTDENGISVKNDTLQEATEEITAEYETGTVTEDASDNDIAVSSAAFGKNEEEVGATITNYGDLNGDGDIDNHDVLIIQKYMAELMVLNNNQKKYGDLNGDNKVDSHDVLIIQKYMARLISKLPYDKEYEAKVLKSFSISSSNVTLTEGKSVRLTASAKPSTAQYTSTWSTSNSSVATVDNSGNVVAKKAGTATVTITSNNGVKASCAVTVKSDKTVKSINLSSTASSITVGNHAYIKATTSPSGQIVNWSSSNTSVAKVSNGIVTGVGKGTATITAKAANSSVKATYKINVTSGSTMSITYTSTTVTAGKSVYLKSGYSGSKWSSSDTSVATVDSKGFVTTKKEGVAIITATNGSAKRTCALTVSAAAPIRFSYTSPNSAALGDNITFVAITDKTRTAVQFKFRANNRDYTINATSKTTDSTGQHYVWKGSIVFIYSGLFDVKAYSQKNGVWSTCEDGNSSVFVANASSASSVATDKRRPSDGLLKMNASYEGFLTNVTDDPLVSDAPTIGHGHVVLEGEKFYNGISKEEAYAFMVDDMNDSVYSSSVNNFMTSNNIKFNQQQFDALVMLVYNLGPGVLSNSSVKSILLNCVESTGSTSTTSFIVNADALNVRSGPGTGYSSYGCIYYGEKVTLVEKTNSQWYKIKTSSGTVGYCYAEYLTAASGTVRNLNRVNKNALISELIQWHHAGGTCYYGLLYRRIDELEIFFYGDYVLDGRSNKYGMRNSCGL